MHNFRFLDGISISGVFFGLQQLKKNHGIDKHLKTIVNMVCQFHE